MLGYNIDSRELARRRSAWSTRMLLTYGRIAIADDDPECLELFRRALQCHGAEICIATNGGTLLALLAECGPFDLIVTDVNMPWLDGLQVVASAREAGINTPVLVVTGLASAELSATIARLGNARLLCKPFGIPEMRNAIAELLATEE